MSNESLASVTLQITPEQVAKVTLAQNKGTLNLSLRNDADNSAEDTPPVTMAELRYDRELPVAARFAEPPAPVEADEEEPAPKPEPKQEKEPAPAVADEPDRRKIYYLPVRTLRGSQSGVVWMPHMDPPPSPPLEPMTASHAPAAQSSGASSSS
jgi:hypothetical protein